MNIAVTEKFISNEIPTPEDFDQWVKNLLAYNIETWGLTDQDYTKIGEQFDLPGNSLWYLPEGNYRLTNGPVSVIGLDAASCDYVNLFVYSVDEENDRYDKMIIMEYGGKRFVKYNDGTDEWHDITNVGDDGVDIIQFNVGTQAPADTTQLWIDTRGIDPSYNLDEDPLKDTLPPAMDGVVALRVWSTTINNWQSYQFEGAMSQDDYDPNHKCTDPYAAIDAAIGEFMNQYRRLLDHIDNKLVLYHITDQDRENYNTTKVYRDELNEWVDVGGKLYNEMVEFIKKCSDEATRASEAEMALDDATVEFEAHTVDDYYYRSKLQAEPGSVLGLEDGSVLSFDEESHTHHMTNEDAARFESKASPNHTHNGDTVEIDSDLVMDRFMFDSINSDLFAGQPAAPKAMNYGNGRLIVLGYGTDDIFYSDDGGQTWNNAKNNFGGKNYMYVEFDENQNAWFAVSDDLVTIMSTDNGLTWEETGTLIYNAPQHVFYEGRYVKIQDGVIHQSMNAFNWYPKTLKVISNGVFGDTAVAIAIVYSPKYPGVFVIVDDGEGNFHICVNDLRNCGIQNLAPEVYDRLVRIKNLDMLTAPTGTDTFPYGEDDVFTDIDNQTYGKRQYFHNGNTIYIRNSETDLEVYKILDSTKIGTSDYVKGLRLLIKLTDLSDWSELEDLPTTLAGYGINAEAEGILTQAEWESIKRKADELATFSSVVYGWSADEITPGDVVGFGVDPDLGIYLYNQSKSKTVLVQVLNGTPLQMGGLSANDNVDFPGELTMYPLYMDHPANCQVNGQILRIMWTEDKGVCVEGDTEQVLKSIKSIRSNLETNTPALIAAQNTDARALVEHGLALEFQIPVSSGKFAVTDACFNSLTHKFMAVGLYIPEGTEYAYPAVTMSSDGIAWSEVTVISYDMTNRVTVGFIRNTTYGHYVVTTQGQIWASDDGATWDVMDSDSHHLYNPVHNLGVGDKCFVIRQGEPRYHIVYATENYHTITTENAPWGEDRVVVGVASVDNKVCVLTRDEEDNLTFYYQTAGLAATWNSVNLSAKVDGIYKMFYDVHEQQLYAIARTPNTVLYCKDLVNFSDWKVSNPRKGCKFEALFSGSNTELYVNIAQNLTILPNCYFSNGHTTRCPISMTGTIDDEGFEPDVVDYTVQYHVAGCYGDGVFMVFAPARTTKDNDTAINYTLFYVNDNTIGRHKTAKFILDTTEVA